MLNKLNFLVAFLLMSFIPMTLYGYDSSYSGAQVDAEIARSAGRNTTVADPGSDAELVSEQAVREALNLKQTILSEGAFVDGDKNLLDNQSGINSGDMSNADVKTAYEANAETNALTDSEKAALHAEAHSIASHNDTTATGTELETLTDGSNADDLHDHTASGGDVSAAASITATAIVIGDDGAKGVKKSVVLIDADGDVTGVKSITITASPYPRVTMNDSDDAAGTAEIFGNSSGGANDIIMSIGVEDSTGEDTPYIELDGVAETVDMLKPTTLQAGDIVLAEMGTDSVDYTKTVGSFKALTPVVGAADDFLTGFVGANLYGGTYIVTTTGTAVLPSPVEGMNFTIITAGAIAVTVIPDTGDDIILMGAQLDANHGALNGSTAGDIIVMQYFDATGWLATSNSWTEVTD